MAYTVKIHNPASRNHGLTCGHSHKSEEAAMECRMAFTQKLRMGWTDGVVEEITKNPAAVALGTLGGKAKSEAKAKSSAANGAKGGRPKLPGTAKQRAEVKKWWKQHRNVWEISQLTGIEESLVQSIVHIL